MRKLTIVFTKSKKKFPIGSWLIRLWTGKEYSHVSRKITLYGDIDLYYQASEGRVNYENSETFNSKHQIIKAYEIDVSDDVYRKISKECVAQAGNKYALLQNLGIALVDVFNFFGIKIKNPWKEGKNCSELLYTEVLKIMYPDLDYDLNLIKPHDIENILISKNYNPCY